MTNGMLDPRKRGREVMDRRGKGGKRKEDLEEIGHEEKKGMKREAERQQYKRESTWKLHGKKM